MLAASFEFQLFNQQLLGTSCAFPDFDKLIGGDILQLLHFSAAVPTDLDLIDFRRLAGPYLPFERCGTKAPSRIDVLAT